MLRWFEIKYEDTTANAILEALFDVDADIISTSESSDFNDASLIVEVYDDNVTARSLQIMVYKINGEAYCNVTEPGEENLIARELI